MTVLFILGCSPGYSIGFVSFRNLPFQSHFRMTLMKNSPDLAMSRQDDVAITHLNFSPEYEKANGSKLLTFLDLFGG